MLRDPRALPPLPPHDLHILLALLAGPRHGYAIIQAVASQTRGETRLGTSTVYAALKRMRADGLIAETARPPGVRSGDQRRRYYRATPFGHAVARAAARRIERLHELVLDASLLETGPAGRGRS
jgi:DNA-binding PadR family transcriptional regulator